ncbi:hypothetical protein ZIOFF_075667 [Zingiber officinale]|uniref:Uncharacterized protein n=1 Tax=Zingiber officinale TaxID=94328 RepID=A0A8J5BUQ7_ZINOF|nr:hypothetical protein ZIOFF_075667 [Zingiber officinale]
MLQGSLSSKRKIHWIVWPDICKPKKEGGLGVRRLVDVATAVSVRLWARFREQNTPWSKYLQQQYCGSKYPVIVSPKGMHHPGGRG